MQNKLAENIAETILKKAKVCPQLGLVLGSGWGGIVNALTDKCVIPYSELSGMPQCGVKGHAGNFVIGTIGGKVVVIIQGRFHLYEGRRMEEVLMPLNVLYSLGVRNVILTNAAGGVNEKYRVGDIMILKDHINFTCKNPLIGVQPSEEFPVFVDMSEVYDPVFRKKILNACIELNVPCHEGVYMQLLGPTFETPAEIRAFRNWGVDAVGMSTVVEAIYARYLKMRVAAISCITNKAAGMDINPIKHEDVLLQSEKEGVFLEKLMKKIIATI